MGRWRLKLRDNAYRLAKRLATDPVVAMIDLRSFSHGPKWIIK